MHARTICNRLRSVNLYLEQTAAMPGQCHFQDVWLDHPQYKNRTEAQSRFLSDNRLICFGSRVPDTTADNGTSQQLLLVELSWRCLVSSEGLLNLLVLKCHLHVDPWACRPVLSVVLTVSVVTCKLLEFVSY